MAELALGIVNGVLPLIDKCENVVHNFFERKDISNSNIDNLKALKRGFATLNEAIESVQSWQPDLDPITKKFVDDYANTVQNNLHTIDEMEPQVEKETIVSRVRRTEKDVEKLEGDAHEIKEFLCSTVAPILRELVRAPGKDEYVRDNNVELNPPRLTLDYNTMSTCEGQLKAAVLEKRGGRVVAVVAHGQGGVGKTCALRGLADDDDICNRFSGGTLYLELGADAKVSTVIQGIARIVKRTGGSSLAARLNTSKTIKAVVDEASTWFRAHTCLFLIDDIWRVNGIDSKVLYALGTMVNEQSRVVYTTRDKHFLSVCEKEIKFSERETHGELARRMLLTHGGFDMRLKLNERNEEAVRGILQVCQGLPLAIGVAGETVRREIGVRKGVIEDVWSEIHERIGSTIRDGHAERYGGVELIVDTSLKILDSGGREEKFERMFRALCVLEKQQMAPIGMLRKLWGLKDLKETEKVVNMLDEVSVVRKQVFEEGKVCLQLHDLVLDIAIRKACEKQEVTDIFRRLVVNYIAEDRKRRDRTNVEDTENSSRGAIAPQIEMLEKRGLVQWLGTLCCMKMKGTGDRSGSGEAKEDEEEEEEAVESVSARWKWWECEDDGYIHNNLCRILQHGGYEKDVVWLLSRPQWTVSRLKKSGIYAVERDLEVGKRVARGESEGYRKVAKHMEMVGKAARMSCSFVNKNEREAWFQIHGRLLWYATQCEMTKRFVEEIEECAPRPWAKASMGFLEQAGRSATDIVPVDGYVRTVRMDEDKVVCCWTWEGTVGVTVFTVASGVAETKEQEYEERTLWCCQVSQDLEKVVIGFEDGAVEIWDTRTGETKRCRGSHEEAVRCVDISADGERVVSGSDDNTVRVWEVESGKPLGPPLVGHTNWVRCVAMSADGERVVSGSLDRSVRVWEVESGEPVGPPLVGHTRPVECVAMSADGERVVSGSVDNSVRVWTVESGEPVEPPFVGHTGSVECVAISADGVRVVSGSWDNALRVWEVGSGEPVGPPLVGHTESVACVGMSANGERVVSGSDGKSVRVWEVESGEPVGPPLVGHTGWVTCVAMSADGERVVSGSRDKTVRVWEVGSGEPVGPPHVGHTDWVRCVAMSADRKRVVSGSWDKSVRVWEVGSGEPAGPPLVGHTDWVKFVAMTADGERVASCSEDNTVRVWEVGSGELVGSPLAHNKGVRRVEVNEDGSRVVSYDYYGMGRVWRVAEGECEVTSRDEGWDAALHALQLQGRWTTAWRSSWYPPSREVTLVEPDGREVVLATCESSIERFGQTWFSEANFAHCKVER